MLEAKIFFGEKLVASIGSEFIENNGEDRKRQEKMSAEEIKQDCETKAFTRLAGRIKKRFSPAADPAAGRQSVCIKTGYGSVQGI